VRIRLYRNQHHGQLRTTRTTPFTARLHGLQYRSTFITLHEPRLSKLRRLPGACRSFGFHSGLHESGIRRVDHTCRSVTELGCEMAEAEGICSWGIRCQSTRNGRSRGVLVYRDHALTTISCLRMSSLQSRQLVSDTFRMLTHRYACRYNTNRNSRDGSSLNETQTQE